MIEIGKRQTLKVLRKKEMGVYLGEGTPGEQGVLLPGKQVPPGLEPGDELSVFVYKDSEDRPIATVREPLLALGEMGILTVAQTSQIGAFLDWGLERDLFLPFKEQRGRVRKGERVFVAVDGRYFGLIPAAELPRELVPAVSVEARVARRRPDGKLVLSVRAKAYKQMNTDAQAVYELIEEYQGRLPFTDKADPELIKLETGLSKNAFKRAVGHLLKEGKIQINEDSITIRR